MAPQQETASLHQRIDGLIRSHPRSLVNPERALLIEEAVDNREVFISACGALATWSAPESTGRSPEDTYLVRQPATAAMIDWASPNNIPMAPGTFDLLLQDAEATLSAKSKIYVCDRVLGADSAYALPVRVVASKALTALFSDNMFRPVPLDLNRSQFAGQGFTLLALPSDKLDPARYQGMLRTDPATGKASTMAVAVDFERRLAIVFGSDYCGTVKKLLFTVMNFLLPQKGVLSLHSAANEGEAGDTALLLGLSGTGKTTLSSDPRRKLLGDDEHAWSDRGVANLEYGCYAKLIRLDPRQEPEIFRACFRAEDWHTHGSIIENAFMSPDGRFDLHDTRLTPNSRGSFQLSAMGNVKEPPVGAHPKTILFLTADANGVLPPLARLSREQAMFWFLMGYTSRVAGTETGIVEPVATFSRFFGSPFMPLLPEYYTRLLGEKLVRHGTRVYLVNTGWSGGPFGVGKRMDISLTRSMVHAALSGELEKIPYEEDRLFHFSVPKSCPGIPDAKLLQPRSVWKDPAEYDRRAQKLAGEFKAYFDKTYGVKGIPEEVSSQCPGK